jgi:hypothetical protein
VGIVGERLGQPRPPQYDERDVIDDPGLPGLPPLIADLGGFVVGVGGDDERPIVPKLPAHPGDPPPVRPAGDGVAAFQEAKRGRDEWAARQARQRQGPSRRLMPLVRGLQKGQDADRVEDDGANGWCSS